MLRVPTLNAPKKLGAFMGAELPKRAYSAPYKCNPTVVACCFGVAAMTIPRSPRPCDVTLWVYVPEFKLLRVPCVDSRRPVFEGINMKLESQLEATFRRCLRFQAVDSTGGIRTELPTSRRRHVR